MIDKKNDIDYMNTSEIGNFFYFTPHETAQNISNSKMYEENFNNLFKQINEEMEPTPESQVYSLQGVNINFPRVSISSNSFEQLTLEEVDRLVYDSLVTIKQYFYECKFGEICKFLNSSFPEVI
jgi:hypothetical protein